MENNPDMRFSLTAPVRLCPDEENLDSDSILRTPVPQASSTIDQNNHTLTGQVCRMCVFEI